MKKVVLDASAAMEIALNRLRSQELSSIISNDCTTLVPDLFFAEIANVCWKYHRFYNFSVQRTQQVAGSASGLADQVISNKRIWADALQLALAQNITVYDATYLHLAKLNKCVLLTLDKKLRKVALSLNVETLA